VAIGAYALQNNTDGADNIALGVSAGSAITNANSVIAIGSARANVSDSCFIGHISGVEVTGVPVVVAANGQLGGCPHGVASVGKRVAQTEARCAGIEGHD